MMPKWMKQDYVNDLDGFFSNLGMKNVKWEKMHVDDLKALHEFFTDEAKVTTLYKAVVAAPVDTAVDTSVAPVPSSIGPGLLGGGLVDQLDGVIGGALDGAVNVIKEEKPIRSALQGRQGPLVSKLMKFLEE